MTRRIRRTPRLRRTKTNKSSRPTTATRRRPARAPARAITLRTRHVRPQGQATPRIPKGVPQKTGRQQPVLAWTGGKSCRRSAERKTSQGRERQPAQERERQESGTGSLHQVRAPRSRRQALHLPPAPAEHFPPGDAGARPQAVSVLDPLPAIDAVGVIA